jgi:DNA-binding transcriptional regulator of glucitol operon
MLGGLALALAFAVVCILLGRWQWGRYEERSCRPKP